MTSSASQENSPRNTYRLMAGVALAILVLLSIAIFSFSKMQSLPWTSQLGDPAIKSMAPTPLPNFSPDSGGVLNPAALSEKWTLLSFWSVSCAPCLVEMPSLNQLALNWQGPEFQIITINVDREQAEDFETAKKFLTDNELVLPTAFDEGGQLKKAFGVIEIPRHFLVNPKGQIIWSEKGAFTWNSPAARDQLLKLMESQTQEPDSDSQE